MDDFKSLSNENLITNLINARIMMEFDESLSDKKLKSLRAELLRRLQQRDALREACEEAARALFNIQMVHEYDMSLVERDPQEVEEHVKAHPGPVLAQLQAALAQVRDE